MGTSFFWLSPALMSNALQQGFTRRIINSTCFWGMAAPQSLKAMVAHTSNSSAISVLLIVVFILSPM